ncbi:hypothetical protein M5C99_08055 [Acidovorax sp. NCPPB 2350]|nr:hypothetical protein M5C99_08055 [Acidovorax sp. NCPPB 2350]
MPQLIEQFLAEEASSYVRKLIIEAIRENAAHPLEIRRKFEFNRFEVIIDFDKNSVMIQDVLEAGSAGEFGLQISEFVRYLSEE